MRLIGRYLSREIFQGVILVLMGFLGLTAFYDLIQELDDIGHGAYRVQHAISYVLLAMPGHVYELMPVAALIGCIYALAQFSSTSEFTAMRAAGMGRGQALRAVIGVGIVLALLTGLAGEFIAPKAQQYAKMMRATKLGELTSGSFRSGFWIKDSLRDAQGQMTALRFVNIGHLEADGTLQAVEIHEFDAALNLRSITRAASATHESSSHADVPSAAGVDGRSASDGSGQADVARWRLHGAEQTRFELTPSGPLELDVLSTQFERIGEMDWASELTPSILAVLAVDPESMSVMGLWRYAAHLTENGQNASRYELTMWKKLVYPVAIVVMVMLALPFGYIQARAGSVGLKLFIGVMLGVVFFFMNGLFSNLGLLNTWPPWIAVSIPSLVALVIALALLARVGRSY